MGKKKHLPDFLCVGTAKAGTTSVFHYLRQHPQIRIPKKETFFYIRDLYQGDLLEYPKQRKAEDLICAEEKFYALYPEKNERNRVGEIGTGYLHHYKLAIPQIKKLLGEDVKIFIILRNPIERTYSAYLHFKKYSISLEDLLSEIEKENMRREQNYDFMWQFSQLSFYAKSVQAYFDHFKEVKVLFYEDLKQDPVGFMNELVHFLGADPYNFDLHKAFNPSGEPQNAALQKMVTGDYWLKRKLRPFYHRVFGKANVHKLRDGIRDRNLKKEILSEKEVQFLYEKFRGDIAELQVILGNSVNLKEKWNIEH